MHWINSEVKTYTSTLGNLSGKGVKTFQKEYIMLIVTSLDVIISFNFPLNTTKNDLETKISLTYCLH